MQCVVKMQKRHSVGEHGGGSEDDVVQNAGKTLDQSMQDALDCIDEGAVPTSGDVSASALHIVESSRETC